MATKKRYVELDSSRGLAILVVVFAHDVLTISGAIPDLYVSYGHFFFRSFMGVFFLMSGVTFAFGSPSEWDWSGYRRILGKRLARLLALYLGMVVIILAMKSLAQGLGLSILKPIESLKDFLAVFFMPMKSYYRSLWFLLVLMLYMAVTPLLLMRMKSRRALVLLLALALALTLAPESYVLAFTQFKEYLIFFLLGYLAGQRYEAVSARIARWKFVFLGLTVLAVVFFPMTYRYASPMFMGLLIAPTLHAVMLETRLGRNAALQFLGLNSLTIYLLNPVGIVLGYLLLRAVFDLDGESFPLFFFVLYAFGIAVPLVLRKYVILRIPILNKYWV